MSLSSKFICKYCNKEYKSSHSRSNHYANFHKDNVSKKLAPMLGESLPNVISTSNNQKVTLFKCSYCDNKYKHRSSKSKHEKICKLEKVDEVIELKKENEEIKNQLKEQAKQMEELKAMLQKSLKIHPKTLQKINNQLNNTNNGTINNFNIVQLGSENLDDIMSNKEKKAILFQNANCINELIRKVHISDDERYKNFKNVYITNLQNNIAYRYDEKSKKFIAENKDELLEKLIDCRMYDIESFFKDHKNELSPFTIKQIETFIKKMEDEDCDMKTKKLGQIKLLLYNGKDEIIAQLKNNEFKQIPI